MGTSRFDVRLKRENESVCVCKNSHIVPSDTSTMPRFFLAFLSKDVMPLRDADLYYSSRFPTSIHHGASPIADRCLDGNVSCLEACAIEFPPLLPRWQRRFSRSMYDRVSSTAAKMVTSGA